VWVAGYPLQLETSKGPKQIHVEMDGVRSAECPKSVMLRNPQASELVQIFDQAQAVGEQAFGSADRWPGAFYDAVGILKSQKERDESAQERAIHKA